MTNVKAFGLSAAIALGAVGALSQPASAGCYVEGVYQDNCAGIGVTVDGDTIYLNGEPVTTIKMNGGDSEPSYMAPTYKPSPRDLLLPNPVPPNAPGGVHGSNSEFKVAAETPRGLRPTPPGSVLPPVHPTDPDSVYYDPSYDQQMPWEASVQVCTQYDGCHDVPDTVNPYEVAIADYSLPAPSPTFPAPPLDGESVSVCTADCNNPNRFPVGTSGSGGR